MSSNRNKKNTKAIIRVKTKRKKNSKQNKKHKKPKLASTTTGNRDIDNNYPKYGYHQSFSIIPNNTNKYTDININQKYQRIKKLSKYGVICIGIHKNGIKCNQSFQDRQTYYGYTKKHANNTKIHDKTGKFAAKLKIVSFFTVSGKTNAVFNKEYKLVNPDSLQYIKGNGTYFCPKMYHCYVSNNLFEFLDLWQQDKNKGNIRRVNKRPFIPIYIVKKMINWGFALKKLKDKHGQIPIENDSDEEVEPQSINDIFFPDEHNDKNQGKQDIWRMRYRLNEYYRNNEISPNQKCLSVENMINMSELPKNSSHSEDYDDPDEPDTNPDDDDLDQEMPDKQSSQDSMDLSDNFCFSMLLLISFVYYMFSFVCVLRCIQISTLIL